MHLEALQKLSRYSKASRALLIDYINAHNGTSFKDTDLELGIPTLLDSAGKSQVSINLVSTTGLSQTPSTLTYWRVDLSTLPGTQTLSIYTDDRTSSGLIAAVQAQYGLYLEEDLVEWTLVDQPLSEAIVELDLNGFEPGQTTEDYTAETGNATYRLSFKPEHYLFYGSLLVHVRDAIRLLDTSIDSRLDLREFYRDGTNTVPQVDLLIPNGELYVSDDLYDTPLRMKLEAALYAYKAGEVISVGTLLSNLLGELTNDPWVTYPSGPAAFNLYGATIVFNGAVTQDYHSQDPKYSYLLALVLGPACNNLSGTIKIGYRYSSSQIPMNQVYDTSHIPPILVR